MPSRPYLSILQNFKAAVSYLCVLISVVIVVGLGTWFAIPLASTHAVVGGMVGVALLSVGPTGVSWRFVWNIALAWIISPAFGAMVAFLMRYVLAFAGKSYGRYRVVLPILSALTVCGMLNIFLALGPPFFRRWIPGTFQTLALEIVLFSALCVATTLFMTRYTGASVASLAVYNLTEEDLDEDAFKRNRSLQSPKQHEENEIEMTIVNVSSLSGDPNEADNDSEEVGDPWQGAFVLDEQAPIFRLLLAVTAAAVAFAHGSNDVSNGIGPFVGIVRFYLITGQRTRGELEVSGDLAIPRAVWGLVLIGGGLSIVAGLALYGHAVIRTIGSINSRSKTFARGFSAQFAASLAVLSASVIGTPLSTSHCVVAAAATASVAFVPVAERAADGLDIALLWKIAGYAVITPFVTAALAVTMRLILRVLLV